MHIAAGMIFVLVGALSMAYAGFAAFGPFSRTPIFAFGALLVGLGAGLWARSRAAALVTRAALATTLVGIGVLLVTSFLAPGVARIADDLLVYAYLVAVAVAAAVAAFLLLLVSRAQYAPRFGAIDLVPLSGVVLALALAVLWRVEDDVGLRPCRVGNDAVCVSIATRLLESAERAPTAAPTPWEERAAGVLAEFGCRGPEPGPCAAQLYAVGSVALRAGRFESARDAFLHACGTDTSWCARAAQEMSMPWTPDEREMLRRRP